MVITVRSLAVGATFYVHDAPLTKVSGDPATILSAKISLPGGAVSDLGHHTYYVDPTVGEPLAWRKGDALDIDPARLAPRPLVGTTFAPHRTLAGDRFSMGKLRLDRAGRFDATDLTVTYRQDGHIYRQAIAVEYHVRSA